MTDLATMETTIRRHLGQPSELELTATDGTKTKFKISPLPLELIPDAYATMRVLQGASETNPTPMFENMTGAILEQVAMLGVAVLKPNYPDVDDKLLKELVLRNALPFIGKIWEQNLGKEMSMNISDKELSAINRMKAKAGQNAKA